MDNNKLKIIELAQAGDKSALSELIKQEQNNIYTTLFYLKKNDNEINDIMQDVLLKLSLKITKLKNPLYFKSWLNQIIVNSYYDYLRKNKKKQSAFNLVKDEDESMQEVPDYTTNPQDSVLYTELDRIIKNSIQN